MVVRAAAEAFDRWHDLGVTDAMLRQGLGLDAPTFQQWRSGDLSPRNAGHARLDDLEALRSHVLETFTTVAAARTWLHAGSRYLDGRTPADTIAAGQFEQVEAALNALDLGVFV